MRLPLNIEITPCIIKCYVVIALGGNNLKRIKCFIGYSLLHLFELEQGADEFISGNVDSCPEAEAPAGLHCQHRQAVHEA